MKIIPDFLIDYIINCSIKLNWLQSLGEKLDNKENLSKTEEIFQMFIDVRKKWIIREISPRQIEIIVL